MIINNIDLVKKFSLKYLKKELKVGDNNLKVIETIINHFNSDDPKGIFLMGPVGTGKSMLLEIFRFYLKEMQGKTYQITDTYDIVAKYEQSGFEALERFGENKRVNPHQIAIKKPIEYLIDEIGGELDIVPDGMINYMGTKLAPVPFVLHSRYKLFKRGYRTHCTSNFDRETLKKVYESRLYDRFNEMFIFLTLTGGSYRC